MPSYMFGSFNRPVGASADLRELEYVSALHQTCVPFLRPDASVSSADVRLYLRSRYGLEISRDDAIDVVRGLGGTRDAMRTRDVAALAVVAGDTRREEREAEAAREARRRRILGAVRGGARGRGGAGAGSEVEGGAAAAGGSAFGTTDIATIEEEDGAEDEAEGRRAPAAARSRKGEGGPVDGPGESSSAEDGGGVRGPDDPGESSPFSGTPGGPPPPGGEERAVDGGENPLRVSARLGRRAVDRSEERSERRFVEEDGRGDGEDRRAAAAAMMASAAATEVSALTGDVRDGDEEAGGTDRDDAVGDENVRDGAEKKKKRKKRRTKLKRPRGLRRRGVPDEEYLDLAQLASALLISTLLRAADEVDRARGLGAEDRTWPDLPPASPFRDPGLFCRNAAERRRRRKVERERAFRDAQRPVPRRLIRDVLRILIHKEAEGGNGNGNGNGDGDGDAYYDESEMDDGGAGGTVAAETAAVTVGAERLRDGLPPLPLLEVNARTVRSLLEACDEFDAAGDDALVEDMVEAAGGRGAVLDEAAFARALVSDVRAYDPRREEERTETFVDVWGFEPVDANAQRDARARIHLGGAGAGAGAAAREASTDASAEPGGAVLGAAIDVAESAAERAEEEEAGRAPLRHHSREAEPETDADAEADADADVEAPAIVDPAEREPPRIRGGGGGRDGDVDDDDDEGASAPPASPPTAPGGGGGGGGGDGSDGGPRASALPAPAEATGGGFVETPRGGPPSETEAAARTAAAPPPSPSPSPSGRRGASSSPAAAAENGPSPRRSSGGEEGEAAAAGEAAREDAVVVGAPPAEGDGLATAGAGAGAGAGAEAAPSDGDCGGGGAEDDPEYDGPVDESLAVPKSVRLAPPVDGWESRRSSVGRKSAGAVEGVLYDRESVGEDVVKVPKYIPTVPFVDYAVDEFKSLPYTMGLWVFYIFSVGVYTALLASAGINIWTCSPSFACTLVEKVWNWFALGLVLIAGGLVIIVPLSVGNNPYPRSGVGYLVSFLWALAFTLAPFFGFRWYENGIPHNESGVLTPVETSMQSRWFDASVFVFTIYGACLSLRLLLSVIIYYLPFEGPKKSSALSPSSGSADLKLSATHKTNALVENAHALHCRRGRGKKYKSAVQNFVLRGETLEPCGGLWWTWRQILSRGMLRRHGVWIFSRLSVGQEGQIILLVFLVAVLRNEVQSAAQRVEEKRQEINQEEDSELKEWALYWVPEGWMVWVSGMAAIIFSALVGVGLILVYIPSMVGTVLKLRSGVIGSLHDPHFPKFRKSADTIFYNVSNMVYALLGSVAFMVLLVGLLIFLFLWEPTSEFMNTLLAWFLGLMITIGLKMVIMIIARKKANVAFYRARPGSANIWALAMECWNIGLGGGVVLGRLVQFLLASAIWIGRIDVTFLDENVSFLGYGFDYTPTNFRKEILVHEAHRHPFIDRLGAMYMTRLKYGQRFSSDAGACWRRLFVLALMPWLMRYRDKRLDYGEHSPVPEEISDESLSVSRENSMQRGQKLVRALVGGVTSGVRHARDQLVDGHRDDFECAKRRQTLIEQQGRKY